MPSKVLNMLENDISKHLSFTTDTSPILLKTAKVIHIHKKDSKSNFKNYLLSLMKV